MKIDELFNKYYDSFTSNDKYICECILNHQNDCIHLSIDEFAYKYHISTSTLSRFAQKLHLPGYSELRAMIRFDEQEDHDEKQNIDLLMNCYNKVIDDIDKKDCSVMFERINAAQRMIIFGEGYFQGRVAKEMKRIFLATGKIIYDTYGDDMISALTHFINVNDIIFLISLNGESPAMVDFAKEMKMRGVYMISITKMHSNSLARICDENLYIQSLKLTIDKHLDYDVTTS
ncbi:MAG: MurR/RpiR family transcriptional regulator [Erysipelotrichaceae bacterium]|nr:MurR/RpiR family transcriptional regulator [Erysipelotrichaceae bacterium]